MKTQRNFKSILVAGLALFLFAQTSFAQQSLQVAAWGLNEYGQAWVPNDLAGAKQVVSGGDFNLALLQDGKVRAWGGRLTWQTNIPPSATNVAAIAACATHCLALRSNGTVVGWGDATRLHSALFGDAAGVTNPPVTGVKMIAIESFHTLTLRSNGTVSMWGSWTGSGGQTPAVPSAANGAVAIDTGYSHALALKSNGTVFAWGRPVLTTTTNVPAGLSEVRAISAGLGHSLALKSNGMVVAWGEIVPNQSNVLATLSNVTAIAAGAFHDLAVKNDGTLVTWGTDVYGESSPPHGLSNVAAISAHHSTSVALVSNTTPVITKQPKGRTAYPGTSVRLGIGAVGAPPLLFQWKHNYSELSGETNSILVLEALDGSKAGNYSVVVSNGFGCVTSLVAQVTLGPIVTWGANSGEQADIAPGATNPASIATYFDLTSPCGVLNQDGSARVWGGSLGTPAPALENISQLSAGANNLLISYNDGLVASWPGINYVFDGTPLAAIPPEATNPVKLASGLRHSMALRTDGTVVAWGQLPGTNVPVDLNDVVDIACGNDVSYAIKSDGRIVAWGSGSGFGLTNVPASLSNAVSVLGSSMAAYAIRANGTVIGWGNQISPLQPPSTLTNVVALSAGFSDMLALRSDGTLVAWGFNSRGETNIPPGLSNVVAIASGYSCNFAIIGNGTPVVHPAVSRRSIHAGDTLQLPTHASSSVPMSYQWFFNDQPLDGQTNAILQLNGVPVTFAGDYTVVVSNAVGVVTSAVTTVTITRDPVRFITTPDAFNVMNDTVNLRLAGLAGGGPVVLYASTNAASWEPIFTNPPVVGVLDIADPAFTNNTYRFYQAVEGP